MDDRIWMSRPNSRCRVFRGRDARPVFLKIPHRHGGRLRFQAVAQLRAQEAADAWPFADGAEARHALSLMVNGWPTASTPTSCGSTAVIRRLRSFRPEAPALSSVYTDRECVVFGEGIGAARVDARARREAHDR